MVWAVTKDRKVRRGPRGLGSRAPFHVEGGVGFCSLNKSAKHCALSVWKSQMFGACRIPPICVAPPKPPSSPTSQLPLHGNSRPLLLLPAPNGCHWCLNQWEEGSRKIQAALSPGGTTPSAREGAGSHQDKCDWGQVALSPRVRRQGKSHVSFLKRCVMLICGLSQRVKLLICSSCSLIKEKKQNRTPPIWAALQGGAYFCLPQVWFRRGVSSHNPCGTSWIQMVGEMLMVNVGLGDQVCVWLLPGDSAWGLPAVPFRCHHGWGGGLRLHTLPL